MLKIELIGDTALIAKLDKLPVAVHAQLLAKTHELTLRLKNYITGSKLSGQVLNRKTGRLIRSIFSRVDETSKAIYGFVWQSADVPYGRIHEFGGQTAAHIILPKKAYALSFMHNGMKVFAKIVHHPGSKMPERSYMRSGLRDMSQEISRGLKAAVVQGMSEVGLNANS